MPVHIHTPCVAAASWRRHWGAPSAVALAAVAAVTASLGLLALIGQVAREAVRQGDLRRQATARHAQATWHCKALPNAAMRTACLGELDPPPPTQPAAWHKAGLP